MLDGRGFLRLSPSGAVPRPVVKAGGEPVALPSAVACGELLARATAALEEETCMMILKPNQRVVKGTTSAKRTRSPSADPSLKDLSRWDRAKIAVAGPPSGYCNLMNARAARKT